MGTEIKARELEKISTKVGRRCHLPNISQSSLGPPPLSFICLGLSTTSSIDPLTTIGRRNLNRSWDLPVAIFCFFSIPICFRRGFKTPKVKKQQRGETEKKKVVNKAGGALPLTSLNHISLGCRSIEVSIGFYQHVLGFVPIRRPASLDFDGAWLFNCGIGIHLLQAEDPESLPKKTEINPKDDHISFQCESMGAVERKLKEMGIRYVQRMVEDGGIYVKQLFFHDPDGFMIEICNCGNLPVVPLVEGVATCPRVNKKQQ